MQKIATPSVQSLLIEMQFDGQPLATGTGFVVTTSKGSYLITNRHNVTGRKQDTDELLSTTGGIPNKIKILHNRLGQLGFWIWKEEALYFENNQRWIEHPVLGPKADFVAIPLSDLADVQLIPYDVINSGVDIFVGPSDSVSVVGFPFGMSAGGAFAIWATGFLASEPLVNYNYLPIQLIDCRSRPGQSGSPVIAYRSGGMVAMADGSSSAFNGPVFKLIGIYSGRINKESDIGIVWRTSAIGELVKTL